MPNPMRRRPASPRAARCESAKVASDSRSSCRAPLGEEAAGFGQPHVAVAAHQQRPADSIFQLRIRLLSAGCDTCSRSAARPKCSVSASATTAARSTSVHIHNRKLSDGPNVSLDGIRDSAPRLRYGTNTDVTATWRPRSAPSRVGTTLAFVPQLFSDAASARARELSTAMLVHLPRGPRPLARATASMIDALPVIAANAVSLAIVSAVTVAQNPRRPWPPARRRGGCASPSTWTK